MLIIESSRIFEHEIFMSAKPTPKNLKSFFDFISKNSIKTIVPLLPMKDVYQFYGFNLIDLYRKSGLNVIYFPIEDYSVPTNILLFDSFIDDVRKALQINSILIHCSAGLGRTGLVSAALLIKYKQYDPKKAITIVRNSRLGTIETFQQEHFLELYDYYLNGER